MKFLFFGIGFLVDAACEALHVFFKDLCFLKFSVLIACGDWSVRIRIVLAGSVLDSVLVLSGIPLR